MSIQSRLLEDMKRAMRKKERERLDLVKKTRAAIKNVEIEKRKELDDEEVLDILGEEVQLRWESIYENEGLKTYEEVEKIKREIGILEEYLPQTIEEEDLKLLVLETINELKATKREDVGLVVSALMPKIKGRAKGQDVQSVVMGFLDS